VDIREGRADATDKLSVLIGSTQFSPPRIMSGEIRGEQFVDPAQLALVPDFFPNPLS
jgi:hypothetical protein